MKNPIHQTAQFITSSSAVTLGLLLIIVAMIFETQTLLYYQLQSVGMQGYKLYFTSFGLSIGIEFIILLFTANSHEQSNESHTGRNWNQYGKEKFFTAPVVFGISSFIINFYFWKAYDLSRPIHWIVFSLFISWLLAYINFKLSDLFVSKWSTHLNQVDLKVKCSELELSKDELEMKLTDIRLNYEKLTSVQKSESKKHNEVLNEYNELKEEAHEMRNKLSRKKIKK